MKKKEDKYQKEIQKIKEDNEKRERNYQQDMKKLKEENEKYGKECYLFIIFRKGQ